MSAENSALRQLRQAAEVTRSIPRRRASARRHGSIRVPRLAILEGEAMTDPAVPSAHGELLKRINASDAGPDDARSNLARELFAALLAQEQKTRDAVRLHDDWKAAASRDAGMVVEQTSRAIAAEQATRRAEQERDKWKYLSGEAAKGLALSDKRAEAAESQLQIVSEFIRDVIGALGFAQPDLNAVISLSEVTLQVVGQIEEGKAQLVAAEQSLSGSGRSTMRGTRSTG